MGCWCTFTQRFLIEMPPKRGDFQCTVCGFRCRGRLSDQIGWWFHWANELHLGTLRIWLFWEGAPLWPRVNQANRLDWYLDPMIYIYIVIWHVYVILCDIIVLWYPMMPFVFLYDFVILHGFFAGFDADHSESGEISDFGSRWLEDIYALKNPSHGHKMRLENLGTMGVPWGCHLGRSFVRFQPYVKKKKQIHVIPIRVNSFFTWKKTKVTGGIWTGWGIFTESRPSKSFCPTPNPAFATASVEVRTICLGAPCSVCSNPVCVDEKCSLWRPEFFVRLRPIWSHEDFTVPLW